MGTAKANKDVELFKKVGKEKQKIEDDYDTVVKRIRNGFEKSVVVFIDLVDSTKFKIDTEDEPEKWIARIDQFSKIVKSYVKDCKGEVVKYIGDEVMAAFKRKSAIYDAINFLNRVPALTNGISQITGTKVEVKVAVDYGQVYFLKYAGHEELDPLGTPVDRCARIAKYCLPKTILTSREFVEECDTAIWNSLGSRELKGIGSVEIFQFGRKTFELSDQNADQASYKICDLLENMRIVAPEFVKIWAYQKNCLVHDFEIEKYKISVDVYLNRLPVEIQLFARDEKAPGSVDYLYKKMCKTKGFLPEQLEKYKIRNGKLIYETFDSDRDMKAIAKKVVELLKSIEKYKGSIGIKAAS